MVWRSAAVFFLLWLAALPAPLHAQGPSDSDSIALDEGKMALQSGRFDDAIEILSHLIAMAPSAESYYLRATAYSGKRRYSLAMVDLNKALSLEPNNPSFRVQRGLALLATGKFDMAIEDFSAVIRVEPGSAEAVTGRARALFHLNRHQAALADINDAIQRVREDAGLYRLKGDILSGSGSYEEAVRAYNKAIALRPNDAVAYNNRGTAQAHLGRNKEAVSDYNKAMDIAMTTPSQVKIPGLSGNAW